MKKVLVYLGIFIAAFIVLSIVFYLIVLCGALFAAFVSWSLPVAYSFSWALFRLVTAFAFVSAFFWSFSKENKEFVEDVMKDL